MNFFKCLDCSIVIKGRLVRKHFREKHGIKNGRRIVLRYVVKHPSDPYRIPIGHFLMEESLAREPSRQITIWVGRKEAWGKS